MTIEDPDPGIHQHGERDGKTDAARIRARFPKDACAACGNPNMLSICQFKCGGCQRLFCDRDCYDSPDHPCKAPSWSVRIPAAIKKAEGLLQAAHVVTIAETERHDLTALTANQLALAKWAWELQCVGSEAPASEITPAPALIEFCEIVESL